MDYDSNLIRFVMLLLTALELLIVVVIVRKRLIRKIPFFSVYICSLLIMSPILILIYQSGHDRVYFFASWIQEGISVAISFFVIGEVFWKTLNDYESIRRVSIKFLIVVALLLTAVSILILPFGTRPSLMDTFAHTVTAAERSLRIVQIGVVVAFFAFSSYLALSWKNYLFGIILGYGLYATVNLSCDTYIAYMGRWTYHMLPVIDSAAYGCTLVIWLIYLMKPDPATRGLPASGTATEDLERWGEAVEKLK